MVAKGEKELGFLHGGKKLMYNLLSWYFQSKVNGATKESRNFLSNDNVSVAVE